MMKRSPVQQMTTAAGNSNWWSINNIISRPVAHHTSSFSAPPPTPPPPPPHLDLLPHYNTSTPPPSSSSFWVDDNEELPAQSMSWSQLVSAGLVEGNDSNRKSELSYFLQTKNREEENWEEQLLPPSNGGYLSDVRQLLGYSSTQSFMYGSNDDTEEYQRSTPAKSSWLPTPLTVSPPASCLTTLNSNNKLLVDLSGKLSDVNGRRHSSEVPKECNSIGASKKARVQPSSTQSTFKVRKEKLGDRITALHQLVSPFGKTDTASVLLEAIGYIRFLHSQIEALSVPYLGKTSGLRQQQQQQQQNHQQNDYCEEPKKELRSRGLCLVPVSSTMQVANYDINGADYWAPVLGGGHTGGGFR